jgi:hypothetical protein
MFWGCYSYDYKGPCHIYRAETKAEKKEAEKEINKLNANIEPVAREE